MFKITYQQEGSIVRIIGYNPIAPTDTLNEVIVFDNDIQAEGFCLTVQTIEAAVHCSYGGPFAVAICGDVVDITTGDPLHPAVKRNIKERIQKVLKLMPIARRVKFYAI